MNRIGDSLSMPRPDEDTYPYLLNGMLKQQSMILNRSRRKTKYFR